MSVKKSRPLREILEALAFDAGSGSDYDLVAYEDEIRGLLKRPPAKPRRRRTRRKP